MNLEKIVYLCIPCIILYFAICFFTKKPQKNKNQNRTSVENILDDINVLITRYNLKQKEYEAVIGEILQSIETVADYSVYEEVEIESKKFIKASRIFSNLIDEIENLLKNPNGETLYNHKIKIQKYFYAIDKIVEKLKDLNYSILSKRQYQDMQRELSTQNLSEQKENEFIYFKGCEDLSTLDKRNKMLLKIYHPDSGVGDNDMFIKIQEEYHLAKEKLGGT